MPRTECRPPHFLQGFGSGSNTSIAKISCSHTGQSPCGLLSSWGRPLTDWRMGLVGTPTALHRVAAPTAPASHLAPAAALGWQPRPRANRVGGNPPAPPDAASRPARPQRLRVPPLWHGGLCDRVIVTLGNVG